MSKHTGSHRTTVQPIGADMRARWKAALAGQSRERRGKRGRRGDAPAAYRAGMNRRQDRPAAGEPAA